MRPATARADEFGGIDQCISLMIEHSLRGKCIELAVFLHHGSLPQLLLAEVVEMATDRWALHDGDDT